MPRIFTFLLTFLVLAACSPLQSTRPPVTLLRVEPVPVQLTGIGSIELATVPELEGEGIALVMQDGARMEYAANLRWAAPLEELLAAAIDSSLPPASGGDRLNIRVEQWHIRQWDAAPAVSARWRVERCNGDDCRNSQIRSIAHEVPTQQSQRALGGAYQQAFAEMMRKLAEILNR